MKVVCEKCINVSITPSDLVCIFLYRHFWYFIYINRTNLYVDRTHRPMDTSVRCVTTSTRISMSHQHQLHLLDLKRHLHSNSRIPSTKCKIV